MSCRSDASAEVVAYLRRLFDKAGVVWQLTEMGKVYYDKETGTYYIVENQKTGDAE